MSQENVEIVRALFDAFARRDHEAAFDYYDAEIERGRFACRCGCWIAGVYHGHEGVRAYWRGWLWAWEDVEATEVEFVDAGQTVVALINQRRLRGRGSGIEVNAPPYALSLHAPEWKGRAVGPVSDADTGPRSRWAVGVGPDSSDRVALTLVILMLMLM